MKKVLLIGVFIIMLFYPSVSVAFESISYAGTECYFHPPLNNPGAFPPVASLHGTLISSQNGQASIFCDLPFEYSEIYKPGNLLSVLVIGAGEFVARVCFKEAFDGGILCGPTGHKLTFGTVDTIVSVSPPSEPPPFFALDRYYLFIWFPQGGRLFNYGVSWEEPSIFPLPIFGN